VEREALLSGLVHPGGREPAPGALRLVQAFVNTVDREHGPDLLDDAAGLEEWLDRQLMPAPVTPAELDRAREVREALRALLLANHGGEPDPAAVATLDRAAAITVAFDAAGDARLEPARTGVDGVVAKLLAIVARAQADGTWRRLKACPDETCGWAFYDRSRNRSRTWCSMSACGNRAKARSYRARHR
jgi:predicted RNA-binding Zn ribbon-like protein